jgi:O-antigen ligase
MHYKIRLFILAQFLIGFFLGFTPEVALIGVALVGIDNFRRKIIFDRELILLFPLGILYLVPLIYSKTNLINILYFTLSFILVIGLKAISRWPFFRAALLLGVLIAVIYASALSLGFFPNVEWVVEPELAMKENHGDSIRFIATNTTDSWVVQGLDYQGGDFVYSLEVRSDKPITVNMGILHEGLLNGRILAPCKFQTTWSECQIHVQTPFFRPTIFGIGGAHTWKAGDPTLEVRHSKISMLSSVSALERLKSATRGKGAALNPNLFGASMVISGLILLILFDEWQLAILSSLLPIFGIFLSGSRNAFFAFGFGVIVLLIARSRFSQKLLIIAALIALTFLAQFLLLLQNSSLKNTITVSKETQFFKSRALEIFDRDGIQTRVNVFNLAFRVFLTSPWLGVGDVRLAMIKNLNSSEENLGLSPNTISHAHNLWLQIAAEYGLIGLTGMLWLWILVARRAWLRQDASALALLGAIFCLNSVDFFFYYAPVHLAFWMCFNGFHNKSPLSYMLALKVKGKPKESPANAITKKPTQIHAKGDFNDSY